MSYMTSAYHRISRAMVCAPIVHDVIGDVERPGDVIATIEGSTMTVLRISYDMRDEADFDRGMRWAERVAAERGVRVFFRTGPAKVYYRHRPEQ